MRYIKREVRDENALLTEESLKDLGWECTGREKLGAGKSALYFRRSREEEKEDAALQRECERLLKELDDLNKSSVGALPFLSLGAGIAAAYLLVTGLVCVLLGSFVLAGCLTGAGGAAAGGSFVGGGRAGEKQGARERARRRGRTRKFKARGKAGELNKGRGKSFEVTRGTFFLPSGHYCDIIKIQKICTRPCGRDQVVKGEFL